jgi:hypothetical protein
VYTRRADLYEGFVQMPGTSYKEKAQAFSRHIWNDPKLRECADYQLTYFGSAHFLVRGSLIHRNLVAQWFPHVAIKMWVMLGQYARDCDSSGIRGAPELAQNVVSSVKKLKPERFPIVMHSRDGKIRFTIAEADRSAIKADAEDYLTKSKFLL